MIFDNQARHLVSKAQCQLATISLSQHGPPSERARPQRPRVLVDPGQLQAQGLEAVQGVPAGRVEGTGRGQLRVLEDQVKSLNLQCYCWSL